MLPARGARSGHIRSGLGAVIGAARGVLPVSADEWPVGRPTIRAVTFKRTAQSRIQTVVANDRSQSAALARVSAPPHGGFEPIVLKNSVSDGEGANRQNIIP